MQIGVETSKAHPFSKGRVVEGANVRSEMQRQKAATSSQKSRAKVTDFVHRKKRAVK